ncbi:MAG: murC [Candidatus Saccharibacteria bacterium]|nr:murC [Candidatus Saccharibacteria bacterium]
MNIYFSGIGGVGIGPLAEIARDAGYEILGSDLYPGLMTEQLEHSGAQVHIGPQDGEFLRTSHHAKSIDWFIYTAALPDNHPELVLARELGIRTGKRDDLLAHIITEKQLKLIAISGSHGKTTTTGMMIWALQQLGITVSYSIGTTISFGPSGLFEPTSEYFVYECDEFDKNFLRYQPYLSLITSIEHDHFDTFPTEDDYFTSFRQFAEQSSHVIAWQQEQGQIFDGLAHATLLGIDEVNNELHLPGAHNRRNATLVQAGLHQLGLTESSDSILNNFPGTDRRFEKLAENLYSDYGHNPAEIAATLQLASELNHQVVLVYQPHQNIRQHEIKDQYTNQFEAAETVYWLPTYLSREDPSLTILPPEELIQTLTNKDRVIIADFDDALWAAIEQARADGKLVICMGAGAIDGWVRDRLKA